MHDLDLSQRLYFAESDFLTALENGTLASYYQTWSTVPDVLRSASKTGNAGNDTLILVNFVASRISNLASFFLDIQREEELSTSQLQSDCDAMFRQMDALNLNAETSSPPFLTSAYRWLLDNLHNPYPTAEVKAQIAAASSCQVSSVNSWFVNVRRRIGWATLCRERFSNCRADMLDAAYRALVKENSRRMLSPEVTHSFIAMKVATEGLYSSTFARSAFAGDLDAVVKDMTEANRNSVEFGKCPQPEGADLAKILERGPQRSYASDRQNSQSARDSYPSPNRSVPASPVPALDDSITNESEEEDDVAPPIIAGFKRRRPSIEPVNQLSSTARRPIKRLRASVTSSAYLPSPPSSTDGIDVPSDDGSPELFPVRSTQSETNKILPSRKRDLSHADSSGIPKHPCGSMIAPHLHTVSDLLPHFGIENEYSIDDWFHTNFDTLFAIPPPVDATEPDSSASWEVKLFRDYRIPGNLNCAPKCLPAPTTDTHISAVTDLPDLGSLLQSIGGNAFVTSSGSVPPSDMTCAPYMAPFGSSIPDMSQTDIDWTSLLNGPDTYQSTIHSTLPQYPTDTLPLPGIDLSMLQLPHIMPSVDSQGDLASKQVKLHQLHAMQEAVRRMEQELQSEGVII